MSEMREIMESEEVGTFTAEELVGGEVTLGLQQRVIEAMECLQGEGLRGFALVAETEESVRVITCHGFHVKLSVIGLGAQYTTELISSMREEV